MVLRLFTALVFLHLTTGTLRADEMVESVSGYFNEDVATLNGTGEFNLVGMSAVNPAKNLALTILQRAQKNTTSGVADLFGRMYSALRHARLQLPSGADENDFRACAEEKTILAYVSISQPGVIHLCAQAASLTNRKKLAQILVHESAHLVGIEDECAATRAEVTAMRASGEGLAFRNGYMESCGID